MAARAVRGPAAAEELTKERRPLFGTVHMRLLVNINTDLKKKNLDEHTARCQPQPSFRYLLLRHLLRKHGSPFWPRESSSRKWDIRSEQAGRLRLPPDGCRHPGHTGHRLHVAGHFVRVLHPCACGPRTPARPFEWPFERVFTSRHARLSALIWMPLSWLNHAPMMTLSTVFGSTANATATASTVTPCLLARARHADLTTV